MIGNKLIKEYKTNNEIDLELIIKEYTAYLQTVGNNISKSILNEQDIEEVLYDTFFSLWINKNKLEEDKPLLPYLTGILKNLLKKKFRNNHININIEDYENKPIDKFDISAIVTLREQKRILNTEVNNLSETDLTIFQLFYYSNKSTKEISKILNMTDINIRSRLHRIRKKLSKRMESDNYEQ